MDWVLRVYREKYADFQGRAQRKEYWLFHLFIIVVAMVGVFLSHLAGPLEDVVLFVLGVFMIGSFVPMLALRFRRLHDTGRTAWWMLLAFLPFLGPIILLVFDVLDGTPGPNRFGPDPKGRGDVVAAFA